MSNPAALQPPQKATEQFELLEWFGRLPTTSAHQARLQFFQPTRKPAFQEERKVETKWGTATIKGKLGQGHADVLEAIFSECQDYQKMDDGTLQVLVDPHKIRVEAGGGKLLSGETLDNITDDLMSAIIKMYVPALQLTLNDLDDLENGSSHCELTKIKSSIIVEIVESTVSVQSRPGALRGVAGAKKGDGERHWRKIGEGQREQRRLWCVTFARFYVRLLERDLKLRYKPREIAQLKFGVSQAIARHIKTHDVAPPGGWYVDELIKVVGGAHIKGKELRNQRAWLKRDAAGLQRLGISLVDGKILTSPAVRNGEK
jgi:hypothetical protein